MHDENERLANDYNELFHSGGTISDGYHADDYRDQAHRDKLKCECCCD